MFLKEPITGFHTAPTPWFCHTVKFNCNTVTRKQYSPAQLEWTCKTEKLCWLRCKLTELRSWLHLVLGRQTGKILFGVVILVSVLAHETSKENIGIVVCGPGCHGWIKAPKVTRHNKDWEEQTCCSNALAVCCGCWGTLNWAGYLTGTILCRAFCDRVCGMAAWILHCTV